MQLGTYLLQFHAEKTNTKTVTKTEPGKIKKTNKKTKAKTVSCISSRSGTIYLSKNNQGPLLMPLASVVLQTNNFILGTWSHCMKTIRNKEHIKDFALAAGAMEVKIPTITIKTQKTNKALLRQTTKKKQEKRSQNVYYQFQVWTAAGAVKVQGQQ